MVLSIAPCLDFLPSVAPLQCLCVSCMGLCHPAHHVSTVILSGISHCHEDGVSAAVDAITVSEEATGKALLAHIFSSCFIS